MESEGGLMINGKLPLLAIIACNLDGVKQETPRCIPSSNHEDASGMDRSVNWGYWERQTFQKASSGLDDAKVLIFEKHNDIWQKFESNDPPCGNQ